MVGFPQLFAKHAKKNPYLSSIVIFHRVLLEKKPSKATINKYFSKLVDKGDYQRKDKDALLEYCYSISK